MGRPAASLSQPSQAVERSDPPIVSLNDFSLALLRDLVGRLKAVGNLDQPVSPVGEYRSNLKGPIHATAGQQCCSL